MTNECSILIRKNKLGLTWDKLKFSLVRVVNEVKVILNSIEVEVAVLVELSLLFLVGHKKTKLMLFSTQLKLKFELSLSKIMNE